MAEFGGGGGVSGVVTEVSDQQHTDEKVDVSTKVNTKALKNFHILGIVFACVSAGFLGVDLAAVVVVVLTAYVFSVLSMAIAMNVLIVLGILAVVFLAGVISGAIFSGVLKGKMIKASTNKPNHSDDGKGEEENPVKAVAFSIAMTFLEYKNRKIERNQLFEYLYCSHTGEFDDSSPAGKLPDKNDLGMLYTKMIEDLEAHCKQDGAQNVVSAFFSEIKEFWNEKSKCIFGDKGVFGWDGNNESLNKTEFKNKSPQKIKYEVYFSKIRHPLMQFIDNDIFENIRKKIKVEEIQCCLFIENVNWGFEEILSFSSKDKIKNFPKKLKDEIRETIDVDENPKTFKNLIKWIKKDLPSLAFSKIDKSKLEKNFNKLKAIYEKI